MLDAQGNRCAICRRLPSKKALAVDHSHKTGQTRGLLCTACNAGIIGAIEKHDIPVENIIAYLKKYSIIVQAELQTTKENI